MIRKQLFYKRNQFGKISRGWKYRIFFGGKMNFDFLFKKLFDLPLPCGQLFFLDRLRSINPHAKSQRALMLVGKRNQASVAQHS